MIFACQDIYLYSSNQRNRDYQRWQWYNSITVKYLLIYTKIVFKYTSYTCIVCAISLL